jgi:hypothetical protein
MRMELLAMPHTLDRLSIAALAACLCLNLLACNTEEPDEPATFAPEPGTWSYEEDALVSNTCGEALDAIDRQPLFTLYYVEGDEFRIELGDVDALCEIDGSQFSCAAYQLEPVDLSVFGVTLNSTAAWEGEFLSETVANGHEVISVTCVGENCTQLDTPCTRDATFTAEFAN